MKRLLGLLAVCILLSGASQAGFNGCPSGFCNPATTAATYQGPADAANATANAAYSCARAYKASYANGTNSLCDLVAVTGGAAVCTLRVATTGFVDLTAYCPGSLTPSAACVAASGGSCKVSKAYNQVSPGTNDIVEATLANMPAITFNAINGLPVWALTSGSSQELASSSTFTQSSPFSMTAVFNRPSGGGGGSYITVGTNVELRGSSSANTAVFSCGTTSSFTASDGSWHGLNATCTGVSGTNLYNLDGAATGSITNGTLSVSAQTLTTGKSSGGAFLTASVAEIIFWSAGLSSTQLGQVFTNQNNSNGYNGAL